MALSFHFKRFFFRGILRFFQIKFYFRLIQIYVFRIAILKDFLFGGKGEL
jgi:hypothetical protein